MLGLQALHQVQDLRADRDVERADGLIGDDHLGLEHQRTRERDPLALAARELVRIALERVHRQADLVQEPLDALILLLGRPHPLHLERFAEDRVDPHPGIERGVRILEHHLQVPARPAQRAVRGA